MFFDKFKEKKVSVDIKRAESFFYEYITKNFPYYEGEKSLNKMLACYLDNFLDDYNDFSEVVSVFYNYMLDYKDGILNSYSRVSESELSAFINDVGYFKDINNNPEDLLHEQNFINLVKLFIKDKNKRILFVGAGKYPSLALKLADKYGYKNITVMDDLYLSDAYMKECGLRSENKYFDQSTDVSKYDIVISSRACSAIPFIPEACKKANIPYFVEVCPCYASTYNYARFGKRASWEPFYKAVGGANKEKVEFYRGYATTIPMNGKNFAVLVGKHTKYHDRMLENAKLYDFYPNNIKPSEVNATKDLLIKILDDKTVYSNGAKPLEVVSEEEPNR